MFSTKEFIEASRDFVCVRLETYESKEHEALIRKLYGGKYANTVFCVIAPDGETKLTRSHRAPEMVLGGRRGESRVTDEMKRIASEYESKNASSPATLQDFNSFRQALNVASGDQRLLLYVVGDQKTQASSKATLAPVFSDKSVIGKFHLDFFDAESDQDWSTKLSEVKKDQPGYLIIHSGQFGQTGKVLNHLPSTATADEVKTALLNSNLLFAKSEQRKVYPEHIKQGRENSIHFETEVPYGEDRDGDGEIDSKGKGKGGKGKGKGGKGKGN